MWNSFEILLKKFQIIKKEKIVQYREELNKNTNCGKIFKKIYNKKENIYKTKSPKINSKWW